MQNFPFLFPLPTSEATGHRGPDAPSVHHESCGSPMGGGGFSCAGHKGTIFCWDTLARRRGAAGTCIASAWRLERPQAVRAGWFGEMWVAKRAMAKQSQSFQRGSTALPFEQSLSMWLRGWD